MKPIGPMMWEHRLIEKMLRLFEGEIRKINESNKIDTVFVDMAVDFIRTYADRTHHGKEEDILFRDLAKKDLSSEHAQIMHELIEEHKYSRETVLEAGRSQGKVSQRRRHCARCHRLSQRAGRLLSVTHPEGGQTLLLPMYGVLLQGGTGQNACRIL